MRNLCDDLQLAWRRSLARPGMALFALATLAIAIAATTAVYALVHHVVLQSLPVPSPERLVWMWNARVERDRAPFSIPDLADYRAGNTVLDGLAAFTNWTANITGTGDAERLEGVRVAPDFFAVVGAEPAHGRLIGLGDDRALRVTVLTDRLWRRRFNADASIVGREITLSGAAYTVIGVLPRSFVFPFRDAELAVPLALETDPRRGDRGANYLRVVARLKTDVSLATAEANLDAIGRRLQHDFPVDDGKKLGVNLVPLEREIVGEARPLLLTLLGAVGLLLFVACTNLTNLLMVSALARRRELSVRLVLGASRARLMRQLLTETTALVTVGGALGLGLAVWLTRLLVWWAGHSLPRLDPEGIALAPGVIGIAMLSTLVAAALCGLVPALHASRSLSAGFSGDGRTSTGTTDQRTVTRVFVAFQVAASLVLLSAVVSTVRSFAQLESVDPGFRPVDAISVQLSLPPARYGSPQALTTFTDRLGPRLTAIAGIKDAAAISLLPLSGLLSTVDFRIVGRALPLPDAVPQGHFRMATPAYFRTMGIPVIEGRAFTDADRDEGQPVAIVSRTFAARSWPDGDAMGAQIVTGIESTPRVIVGVVADVQQFSLDAAPTADLYIPVRQMPANQAQFLAARMYWVVGAGAGVQPDRLASVVRDEIRRLDPEIATSTIRSLETVVADSLHARRFNVQLVTVFGQAGLVLVAIGVYGVTAFAVSGRRREMGIRVAFGATRSHILRLVIGSELRAVAAGLVIGAVTAVAASTLLSRWLFVPAAANAWSVAGAAAALMAVAVLASYVPARASVVRDPSAILRS